jgi:dienelactone hydrolase
MVSVSTKATEKRSAEHVIAKMSAHVAPWIVAVGLAAAGCADLPSESHEPAGDAVQQVATTSGADAGLAAAANDGASAVAADAAGGGDAGVVTFPPTGDLSKDGSYKSTTLKKTGPNGKYTVYLPQELGKDGVKHPIVGWMSGGGSSHTGYPLLPRLATHGFVVVAPDVSPSIGQEVDLGKQILAGIEWAIAENTRAGSPLQSKLNASRAASIGYSMGGLASFTIASDPRITTTVHISGGNHQPDRVKNLRRPAAFICGRPSGAGSDIAAANCDRDFKNATTPVFYANFNGGHLGIQQEPTRTQIATLTTTWLRWQLMDDSSLASTFVGAGCKACTDPVWKVQQKNLD